MARQIVFSAKAAKPPPTYSQAVKAAGLVFVSGTAPVDPNTGAIKGTTIQDQTAQCLTNIRAILEEAGSSLDTQIGVVPLIGTRSEIHMREDLDMFDFELSDEEPDKITALLRVKVSCVLSSSSAPAFAR